MSKLRFIQTAILSSVILASFSSAMPGTAPHLAIGRFGDCNYTSFIDVTNHLGVPCQITGVLHRGAGLGPRIPVEITAPVGGEAFLLKGSAQGAGNVFSVNIAPDGSGRINFARLLGGQGFTTFAATLSSQCQAGISHQAGYEINCSDPSKDDAYTYNFSKSDLILPGNCATAPIHKKNTSAAVIVGPPNTLINWEIRSRVRSDTGTLLDENTFSTNGEHRPNTILEFNPGLADLDQFPDTGTWEFCGRPKGTPAGWAAVSFQEVNEKNKIGAAYHAVGPREDKCKVDQTTLCLGPGGRFKTQMMARDSADDPLQAVQTVLFDDFGYFFSNDPEWEVVIKVLDACNFEGFNSFWVFAAGTTDVEVTLTVTDTQAGVSRTYTDES